MIDIDGHAYLEGHEAADRLGVKPETLYAYVSRGRLKSYRQGARRRRLYSASEVDAMLSFQPPADHADDSESDRSDREEATDDGRFERAHPLRGGGLDLPAADSWAMER